MKVLVDMNLSPGWVEILEAAGWESTHWAEVGDPTASDKAIMAWARSEGFVVFTHDLDFGALLAATGAVSPSVVQLRCEDTRPETMKDVLVDSVRTHETDLQAGALMTIDPRRMRISLLPLKGT
jgi:predicted nuclease of predicted toxin-antitoxin system